MTSHAATVDSVQREHETGHSRRGESPTSTIVQGEDERQNEGHDHREGRQRESKDEIGVAVDAGPCEHSINAQAESGREKR